MLPSFLKKDSYLNGILLGFVAPVVFYGLLRLLDMVLVSLFGVHLTAENQYLYLLSLALNVVLFRYYFVALKAEKTGKSVLLITIALILVYFFMFFKP